jgi:predicted RNase H-like HicB family nuclease
MIIIIIKFPCEIIILQIYDRNKYYIIEVPDIKGIVPNGTFYT